MRSYWHNRHNHYCHGRGHPSFAGIAGIRVILDKVSAQLATGDTIPGVKQTFVALIRYNSPATIHKQLTSTKTIT